MDREKVLERARERALRELFHVDAPLHVKVNLEHALPKSAVHSLVAKEVHLAMLEDAWFMEFRHRCVEALMEEFKRFYPMENQNDDNTCVDTAG